MTPTTTASIAEATCHPMRKTTTMSRMTFHIPGIILVWFEWVAFAVAFANAVNHHPNSNCTSFRSLNEIPPITKTQYFYKTHQSASVYIPNRHHRGRIPVGPDENETDSYVTKVDTTHLGPRKHQKRERDDEESLTKPFFRTGWEDLIFRIHQTCFELLIHL